jgi:hypothetical protein
MPKTSKKITSQNVLLPAAAVAVWIFMQVFMFLQNGIVTGLESTKYINEANHFLAMRSYSSGNFIFYSTEILLIAFCIKLGISFLFVVLLQIIINGI